MEAHYINPGPIDPCVLNEQNNHRSSLIWNEPSDTPLVIRRWDRKFWDFYEDSHERVKLLIHVIGFGGVAKVGYYILDHGLITALIERWRPETHTFHFTCGETTITLEDISLLWGLPTEGNVVTGGQILSSLGYFQDLCERCLGFRPAPEDLSGRNLKKHCLERVLSTNLPVDATEVQFQQRARALALYLIGGLLFANHSGNLVSLRYLTHLEDITSASNLSWGSAVLAYLYRSMCTASRGDSREICGPLVLLQLWAWERIPMFRPGFNVGQNRDMSDLTPLGAYWNIKFDLTRLPTNVLLVYRDQLDSMSPNQFIWMPYINRQIADRYIVGRQSWAAVTPLICWEIVERHSPDRATRQFGITQQIPKKPPMWHAQIHNCQLRGNFMVDWSSYHRQYIDLWNNRLDYVVDGVIVSDGMQTHPDYFTWYNKITRLLVGNSTHRGHIVDGYVTTGTHALILVDVVEASIRCAEEYIERASPELRLGFEFIRDTLRRGLNSVSPQIACHGSNSIMTRSQVNAQSILRPKDRILTRGVKGVKRGGKRHEIHHNTREDGSLEPVVDEESSQPMVNEKASQTMVDESSQPMGDKESSQPMRDKESSQPMREIDTLDVEPSQPQKCMTREVITYVRTRSHKRKTIDRYTPG